MRIIGGTFKGLQLASWKTTKNKHIRPMMDSVKETLFNVLQPHLNRQTLFLDLYSGTGSLAMEAVSRGVHKAHAVESHPESIELIKKNKNLLKDKKNKLSIHKNDVFYFMKSYRSEPFHVIVASPPFPAKLGEKTMENLVKSALYILGTVVVVEISSEEDLKKTYSPFQLFAEKDFNDKKILFYRAEKENV